MQESSIRGVTNITLPALIVASARKLSGEPAIPRDVLAAALYRGVRGLRWRYVWQDARGLRASYTENAGGSTRQEGCGSSY